MNLSRRLFLGGAIALAGASIIPAQAMPRIVGDGRRQPNIFEGNTNTNAALFPHALQWGHDFTSYSNPRPAFSSEEFAGLSKGFFAVAGGRPKQGEGGDEKRAREKSENAGNNDEPNRVCCNNAVWFVGLPAILGVLIGGLCCYLVAKCIDANDHPSEPQDNDWYG